LANFFAFIPIQQEHGHGGEETALKEPQEKSAYDQAGVVLDESHAHAYEAPAKHEDRDDPLELEALDIHCRGELVAISWGYHDRSGV
jgi:hypothetical protein